MRLKRAWAVVAKALGNKAHTDERIADQVALLRLAVVLSAATTNLFIVAGVVRHWND